jgi:hypothetical protein
MHLTEATVEKLLKGQLAGEERRNSETPVSHCPECIQLAHTVAERFGNGRVGEGWTAAGLVDTKLEKERQTRTGTDEHRRARDINISGQVLHEDRGTHAAHA